MSGRIFVRFRRWGSGVEGLESGNRFGFELRLAVYRFVVFDKFLSSRLIAFFRRDRFFFFGG